MDRDPVRFVWRAAPGPNLLALALAGAGLILAWLALDLVRSTVDDVVLGRLHDGTAAFLRLAVPLPRRLGEHPLVLLPGWVLDRPALAIAVGCGLLAAAACAAGLAVAALSLRDRIAARAVGQARLALVDAVSGARPSAREEARAAAALAGEPLSREAESLGSAGLAPVLAFMGIALALVRAVALDWRLAATGGALLLLYGFVRPFRLVALGGTVRTEAAEGTHAARAVRELVGRLPAIAAHGTARAERGHLVRALAPPLHLTASARRRAALAAGAALFAVLLGLAALLVLGSRLAVDGGVSAGDLLALLVAFALAGLATEGLARWRLALTRLRALLEEIARARGRIQARARRSEAGAPLVPGSGALEAVRLDATDPATAARLAGLNLALTLPAHVALTGEPAAASLFAELIGGVRDPEAGRLSLAGVDLGAVEAHARSRRIAFAAGAPVLVPGSLRDNLLYGDDRDRPETDPEQRLVEAIATAGLATFVYGRGLSGRIDPEREPKLAADIVAARWAVRAALAAERLEDLVEPFDRDRYNGQATVAENILFGVPLGDTFRTERLAGHPFVRAILEAEGLDRPLAAMGLAIARSTVDIFADLPDGHPLFERFSFYPSQERGYFEELVARDGDARRGTEGSRERERIMGLALRYCEPRHRLGLLDGEREARLLAARRSFASLLPASLRPAIEFYDPDRICTAASLADNLLFGRVAEDRAGAQASILRVARRVLSERDLNRDVIRVGLDAPMEDGEGEVGPDERAGVDLARCLVRGPDVLVVGRPLQRSPGTEALVARLRRAFAGRSLFLVLPDDTLGAEETPYDATLRFARGTAAVEDRRAGAIILPP